MFACISFPFLFGVMFGDIGHGLIMFLFAIALCAFEEKLRPLKELEILLTMRYCLLLMGFFATYMGLIYNDFMSMPLSLFGPSCYKEAGKINIKKDETCVYPFGFDPVWMNSANDIPYYNSFKMKTSVIIGIT